jgi:nucleotide-binding universal stress UspA family protein
MNFLLPVDGSSACRRAENFATELLDPETDTITVLCVLESRPIGDGRKDPETTSIREQIMDNPDFVVDETIERLEGLGFTVESRMEDGDAADTILEVSKDADIDAIIIGRQGRGAVEEFLLGSVSKKVVTNAPVPVLTVPAGS